MGFPYRSRCPVSIGVALWLSLFAVASTRAAEGLASNGLVVLAPSLDTTATQMGGESLDARQLACRFACNWWPARQLRLHAQSLRMAHCSDNECELRATAVIVQLLCHQALHQEDLAAASGLRAYYGQIAGAEQTRLLEATAEQVRDWRNRQHALMQKGVAASSDLTDLDRQELAIEDQLLQATQRRNELSESIRAHALWHWSSDANYEPLEVQPQAIDVAFLEQYAVQNRHDLAGVRCLQNGVNSDSAPILVSAVGSMLGAPTAAGSSLCWLAELLGNCDSDCLADNVCKQLRAAEQSLTEQIQQQTRQRAQALDIAYQRWQLAIRQVASWQLRGEQLRRLQELGEARPVELAAAEAGLTQARANELQRRVDARMAEIDLAETLGGVAARCCQQNPWLVTSQVP